jgi:hypothetical protein
MYLTSKTKKNAMEKEIYDSAPKTVHQWRNTITM